MQALYVIEHKMVLACTEVIEGTLTKIKIVTFYFYMYASEQSFVGLVSNLISNVVKEMPNRMLPFALHGLRCLPF